MCLALGLARKKRPTTVSKETYYSVKRDLLQCKKRPTTVSKETYYSVKRDLLQCQKRSTTVSKETYYSEIKGKNFATCPRFYAQMWDAARGACYQAGKEMTFRNTLGTH